VVAILMIRQVESLEERGQGPKVIAGGSAQSPRLRSRNTTHINEGEVTLLSEGDVVVSRQNLKRRMVWGRCWREGHWKRRGSRCEIRGRYEERKKGKIGRTDKAVGATKNAEQIW
jgi:hypothetical protein